MGPATRLHAGIGLPLLQHGYLALGLAIEKVSGTRYEDFIQTSILKPLGMADTGYDTGDDRVAVGYTTGTTLAFPINMALPHAAGALYSTGPDLLRWQLSLLAGTLLDPSGTKTMTTPAVETTDVYGFGYSYGIFVSLDPAHRILAHEGAIDGFLSWLSHDTSTGLTLIVLTNHEDTTRLQLIDEVLTESAPGRQGREKIAVPPRSAQDYVCPNPLTLLPSTSAGLRSLAAPPGQDRPERNHLRTVTGQFGRGDRQGARAAPHRPRCATPTAPPGPPSPALRAVQGRGRG